MKISNVGQHIRTLATKIDFLRTIGKLKIYSGKDIEKVLLNGSFWGKNIVIESIKEVIFDFSIGLSSLSKSFNTNDFVLGGGIFDSDLIFNKFNDILKEILPNINIHKAKLGGKAGAIGAAVYLINQKNLILNERDAVIGVDIGASKIRFISIDKDYDILNETVIDSPKDSLFDSIIDNLIDMQIKTSIKKFRTIGVGLGIPGKINNGIIEKAFFLRNYPDFPLEIEKSLMEAFLKTRFLTMFKDEKIVPIPVKVINDAESACFGEKFLGEGKNLKNFIMITFGSGLGGAICDKNGHIRNIEPGGKMFSSRIYRNFDSRSQKESFEYYVSTNALIRRINEKIKICKN